MIRLPSCYDYAIFVDIFYVLSRTRAYIIYYAHARMRKLLPKCLFILLKNYRCWLSVTYKENAKISQKSCLEIWSIQKKAVPLHPISRSLRASRKMTRNLLKIVMLIISHLWRKCKENWKKLLENLVSPKKSSTFAADFALNEKGGAKSRDLWEIEAIDVVQVSRNTQIGRTM